MAQKDQKGLTAQKENDFSEWYTQLIQKAELIEYSPVSGCYILRPNAYHIWEKVQSFFDALIKADGVKNCYFPLFIPESLLTKEKKHVAGFAPEVAWVDYGGDTKLGERLAVRPTSETIMYDAYAKWIRSHKDLPLRLNQWNNVVRWEFKHCTPFLRSREFLWQEGHSVFSSDSEVRDDTFKMLNFYEQTFREMYAIPTLKGKKSEGEKFAGAVYTLSVEAFLPNGKAIQGATSHHLGQNFAKAFDIQFSDDQQQKQYAWQNSWGISTRSIGMMILMHSDNKGLVLPPKVALTQVVIVPILFDNSRKAVLKEAQDVVKRLTTKNISVHLDDRDDYTPGWKFNEWEMKGIPIRVELGPKDLEKKQVLIVRRDTGEKKAVSLVKLDVEIPALLETIQQSLFDKAEKYLKRSIVTVLNFKDAEKQLKTEKLLFVPWCGKPLCEEEFKEKTGAKSLNSPFEQPALKNGQKCFACAEKATVWFYFGKSY
ncbi:proline--tRNA ligase [Candidatus Woesearchaeota archaeon]|nr:proline--tRNA ligase [Candidatus Woesearchaeota archaeon]